MTWKQKFNETFPYIEKTTILAGENGILEGYRHDSNLEYAVKNGNREDAQRRYDMNIGRFTAYKAAWKLYKKYPGPKRTIPVGNTWSEANIRWNGDLLIFPVPQQMEIDVYLLKASRLLSHWERRLEKIPTHRYRQV
jgi:hypothetical protein